MVGNSNRSKSLILNCRRGESNPHEKLISPDLESGSPIADH